MLDACSTRKVSTREQVSKFKQNISTYYACMHCIPFYLHLYSEQSFKYIFLIRKTTDIGLADKMSN